MCGRYALALRPFEVRELLEQAYMPVDEAPDDDAVRQSYNVAPGYNELVYRADVPDWGAGPSRRRRREEAGAESSEGVRDDQDTGDQPVVVAGAGAEAQEEEEEEEEHVTDKPTRYKLQAMKWGLVPSWTRRNPDYATMLRTINCRDDSLAENRSMWTNMKQRKRCIVICQGFYEWLKKNGGKERIPHYIKRKDGQLMCFAGLWDCVKYQDSEDNIYTYTIVTTASNAQLSFLHDRMPVILDPGSDALRTWLDPGRYRWTVELQGLLKPFTGELEIYPVSKEVGKVGNNSPSFIIPVDSKENKQNIANFFANAKSAKGGVKKKEEPEKGAKEEDVDIAPEIGSAVADSTDSNAPVLTSDLDKQKKGTKRVHSPDQGPKTPKAKKTMDVSDLKKTSPVKSPIRKTRSAVSNGTKSPAKKAGDGSMKITSFFSK